MRYSASEKYEIIQLVDQCIFRPNLYNDNLIKVLEMQVRYIVSIQNLHDFRYEGGAPINSGTQIPVVIDKKEYGPSQQARTT